MAELKCYKLTDDGLKLVGVVDDYTSFTFKRKYSDVGEWQLTVNALSDNAKLIKGFEFISNGDGVAGIVKKVTTSVGDKNIVTYSGIELKGIINQRIVMPPFSQSHQSYTNTAPEVVIANIIDAQLINCEVAQRQIPHIRVADYQILVGRTIDYNGRFSNAYDDITTIATTNNIGWYADIQPIEENEQYAEIVFHIYNGLDRSINQSTNSRLILSYENDSLASTTFEANKGIPTTVIIAGQGEGIERSIAKINDAKSGLERNELYVDARDISDDALLPQRGQEALAEYGDDANYQIIFNELLIERYKNDFDLGDIGTIEDSIVGSTIDFRLTEITEVFEQGAYRIEVTFGYDKQTLGDALRRSNSSTQALLKVEGIVGGDSGNIDAGTLEGKTLSDLLLMMYPIGAIYTTVNPANPSTLFGGTWAAWGSGRVPVGVNTGDSSFNTVEKTGGSKTVTLAEANLPAHTHSLTSGSATSAGAHTHSVSGTISSVGDHTHSVSGTAASAGSHTHNADWRGAASGSLRFLRSNSSSDSSDGTTTALDAAGAHTHSVSGTAAADGGHNHTFSSGSAASAGAHTHSLTGNTGSTGSGTAITILPPYITCYMWKRTA